MKNAPLSSVTARRRSPVAELITVMVAPGTTAPLSSVTVPCTPPLNVCAEATDANRQTARTSASGSFISNRLARPALRHRRRQHEDAFVFAVALHVGLNVGELFRRNDARGDAGGGDLVDRPFEDEARLAACDGRLKDRDVHLRKAGVLHQVKYPAAQPVVEAARRTEAREQIREHPERAGRPAAARGQIGV